MTSVQWFGGYWGLQRIHGCSFYNTVFHLSIQTSFVRHIVFIKGFKVELNEILRPIVWEDYLNYVDYYVV